MMWLLLFSSYLILNGEAEPGIQEQDLLEWIYQAEVHQKIEDSTQKVLAALARETDTEQRKRLARTLSIIHRSSANQNKRKTRGIHDLARPDAVVYWEHQGFLLVQNYWLALGDWIGPYFILDINRECVLVEHLDGHQREIQLGQISNDEARTITRRRGQARLYGAPLADLLAFVSRQVELNFFIPEELDYQIKGYYSFEDWLSFLDHLGKDSGISWTRRTDNIIFHQKRSNHSVADRISGVQSRNQNLGAFLQDIAHRFDMELALMDDSLFDVHINIHLADQPWDEVLDCLSIMNRFQWFLEQRPNAPDRLIIHRD